AGRADRPPAGAGAAPPGRTTYRGDRSKRRPVEAAAPGSTRGRAGGGAFHRGPVRTAPPAPPPPPPGRRRPDPSVKRRPGARRGAGGAPRGPPPVPRADRA